MLGEDQLSSVYTSFQLYMLMSTQLLDAGSLPFTLSVDSCGASFLVILLFARWGLYEPLWAC